MQISLLTAELPVTQEAESLHITNSFKSVHIVPALRPVRLRHSSQEKRSSVMNRRSDLVRRDFGLSFMNLMSRFRFLSFGRFNHFCGSCSCQLIKADASEEAER